MTAVLHAARTETEILADFLVALILEDVVPRDRVARAMELGRLNLDALRDAQARRERFGYQPPKPRPVFRSGSEGRGPVGNGQDPCSRLPSGPASSGGGSEPAAPRVAGAASPSPRPTSIDRQARSHTVCGRCRQPKPDDAYANCPECRAYFTRVKADRRAERDASRLSLVKALAPVVDLRLRADGTGFELVCAECRQPIREGEAVVHVECPAEDRGPRSCLGEVTG